jgi:hypothetical protein
VRERHNESEAVTAPGASSSLSLPASLSHSKSASQSGSTAPRHARLHCTIIIIIIMRYNLIHYTHAVYNWPGGTLGAIRTKGAPSAAALMLALLLGHTARFLSGAVIIE